MSPARQWSFSERRREPRAATGRVTERVTNVASAAAATSAIRATMMMSRVPPDAAAFASATVSFVLLATLSWSCPAAAATAVEPGATLDS